MAVGVEDRPESGAAAGHIARVAARLFAARGYDATPVQAIVQAAGVTKPTLYYHFGSKEGLARALVSDPLNRLAATMRAILDGPGGGVAKSEAMAEAHFAFMREDPDRSRFLYALFFGPLATGLAAELARISDSMCDFDAEAARRLAEDGVIPADRADDWVKALRGMIVTRTMGHLYKGEDLGPDLARRLVGDLLWGFAGPGMRERGAGR